MGCMDQGSLKETQGLNPSAWNAHLYIYIYGLTVSPGLLHHGLVFGILLSKCLHADPLSGLMVCTLHPFFPTFSLIILCIVSHVILLYFLVEFLCNRSVVC
jgi:hypothetical protein